MFEGVFEEKPNSFWSSMLFAVDSFLLLLCSVQGKKLKCLKSKNSALPGAASQGSPLGWEAAPGRAEIFCFTLSILDAKGLRVDRV